MEKIRSALNKIEMDAAILRKEHREMTEQKRMMSEQLNRSFMRKEPKVLLKNHYFFLIFEYNFLREYIGLMHN